jgi:TonB family protein
MIEVVSMLLLVTAEPVPASTAVTKVDLTPAEAVKMKQEAEAEAAKGRHPQILNPTMDIADTDYPADAIRAGEQGMVQFSVDVGVDGKPTGCSVLQTSGHSRLDEKTCQIAMERATFRPARDEDGKAIASTWSSRVKWVLPTVDYAGAPPMESYVAATIQIGADGTLGDCTVESSGNSHMTVPGFCEQAKARHAKTAKEAARWWKSLTDVLMTSNKDAPPNVSKPEWGIRASRLLSAQLMYGETMKPIACETILSEGWSFGGTACPPPDMLAPSPPNPDWSKARTTYIDFSTYGQLR